MIIITYDCVHRCVYLANISLPTPTKINVYFNCKYLHLLTPTGTTEQAAPVCSLLSRGKYIGHFQVPKNCTLDAKTEKLRPLFLCKDPPKWWITYLFYAFNTSGWVLSQLFKNWLIWSLFLLLKWRTWLGCGVTGWTNFKVIFLFLLLTIHDLTSIGPVAGGSDNFLIFWAALMAQSPALSTKEFFGGISSHEFCGYFFKFL